MKTAITEYIKSLQKHSLDSITEHSNRGDLESLLETAASQVSKEIDILHEPRRREGFGSPDFKVSNPKGIIGYAENKKIGENLDEVRKSGQIKKYNKLSDNILITNYTEFMLLKGSEVAAREVLCFPSDLEKRRFRPDNQKIEAVRLLLQKFFDSAPVGICRADEFAKALAVRSHYLRDFLIEELEIQREDATKRDRLYGLKENLENHIFNELSNREFSDAYAQMLSYGLFLAKLNADTKHVNLRNLDEFIPSSFQLIRELVEFLKVMRTGSAYKKVGWIIEEILSIINNLDLREILKSMRSFGRYSAAGEEDDITRIQKEKDPYVYFYEDFLAAFDKSLKKSKGVYFTPPAIVNFIIRAVDDILKRDFNIKEGFADRNKVTVLDFATGTGTFLLEILQTILDELPQLSGKRDMVIREHILKNLYGFEYLIAPYTVAHLKLSQYLKDQGYEMRDGERLQVYLTNTLEPVRIQMDYNFPRLSGEGKRANEIKEKPILVITGNPPYSYTSQNVGKWISEKIRDYYFVDGEKLKERNPKGLQDDYVKFIRFAQWKIEKAGEGVVGIITNHSFLDNPTFRGMRQSLMNTFDQMYFLDLHGNAKKKEKTPDGGKDENVFDIEQGVAVSIMIKRKGLDKGIFHSDYYGLRNEKYLRALSDELGSIEWQHVVPESPFYIFKWREEKSKEEYNKFISLKDIFNKSSVGVVTSRDHFVIAHNLETLDKRIHDLLNRKFTIKEIKNKYNLKESKNFDIEKARLNLRTYKKEQIQQKYVKFSYRPFDDRFLFYDENLIERTRKDIMLNFQLDNIAIVAPRQILNDFKHIFITKNITNYNYLDVAGRFGSGFFFPLYILKNKIEKFFFGISEPEIKYGSKNESLTKTENFTTEFRKYINSKYTNRARYTGKGANPTPEDILGYIYAVLHSSEYRAKYAEFLKIDFPRIPFPDDEAKFYQLSALGRDLVQKHLMNEIPAGKYSEMGAYKGAGDNEVKKPDYREKSGKLFINETQYFENVPSAVYGFHIGGYQVLDKYLKDRKKRVLSLDEIENVENVVKILAFTIDRMKKINDETKDWI